MEAEAEAEEEAEGGVHLVPAVGPVVLDLLRGEEGRGKEIHKKVF